MDRFLWTLTAFFAAAAVGLAIARAPAVRPFEPPPPGESRRWTYSWPEEKGFRGLPDRFTLPVGLTLTDSPDSAVRVVLHAEGGPGGGPAAGLFVEAFRKTGLGAAWLRLGRIEGGVALERWSGPVESTTLTGREDATPEEELPLGLEIRRRGAGLAVILDGRLVVCALEPAFSGGRTAVAFSGGGVAKLGRVSRLSELPGFSDDFMRTQEEPGPWEAKSGEWVIETLPTPSMSANGFSYRGRSVSPDEAGLALAGQPGWDQYRLAAAARGEAGEALGLVFAAQPDGRYALFRWTSREKPGSQSGPRSLTGEPDAFLLPGSQSGTGGAGRKLPGEDEVAGRREIVLVAASAPGTPPVEKVLARSAGGYIPEQWYRIEVEFEFGRARVYVDGHELLSARSPELISGLVGLWSSGEKGATFDDVLVAPYTSIEHEFGTPSAPRRPGPDWEALGGEWVIEGGGLRARTRPGEKEAKLLTGSPEWRRFTVRAGLAAPRRGEAGVVANYRDEGNYVLLKTEGRGRFSLERVRAGSGETLAAASGPDTDEIALELRSDRGYLAGYVNGELLLESWDGELLEGRTGLWVAGGRGEKGVRFSRFRSELVPHRPPVNVVNVVFEADNLMSRWAGESADWYHRALGHGRVAHWHHALFYGDVELALDLPAGTPQSGRVVLGVSKTPDHPNNGYGWEFEFAPSGPEPEGEAAPARTLGDCSGPYSGPHGKLWREGETVGEVSLDSGHRLDSVFIRRQGRYVVAGVNGQPLAHFVDPDPLRGGRIAYLVDDLDGGVDVKPSHARLYGGLFFDYLFARAPVEWRAAAGFWEVTSRWECDWRWSFFVGRYDPDSPRKEAVAWNKRSFPGDVLIDFYVGPMMEGKERGRRYEYIRDMNVTIAADGKDLTTGYTFMFAGFGNKASAILRRDKIVAEDRRPQAVLQRNMRIHQKWHHVRVERKGGLLQYTVDFEGARKVDLSYDDPEPLEGDRIALWTYDCGNVYARFRIAAGERGDFEHPDFVPPAMTRTFYDHKAHREPGEDARGEARR